MVKHIPLGLTLALLLCPCAAWAEEVVIEASADALLAESGPDTNFGSATELTVQNRSNDYEPVFQFDLSEIAAGSVITGAVLKVEAKDGGYSGGVFDVYLCKTDGWAEGSVTWNSMAPTPHYVGSVLASVNHPSAGVIEISSSALTAAIQDELDGDETISLIFVGPNTSHDVATIYSREKAGFQHPTPHLEVVTITTIVASADALLAESAPDTNFGGTTELAVQNRSNDYEPVFQFDLSGVPAGHTITDVTLKVEAKDGGYSGGVFDVYLLKTDNWAENTVTWNSMAPTPHYVGSILASVNHPSAGVIEINSAALTAAVQAELASDETISLIFIGPNTSHDTATIYSREKPGFLHPTLEITSEPTTCFTDNAALNTALASAQPGDTFYIANGTYNNWVVNCTSSGASGLPITLAAETPGGVTFTGSSTMFTVTGNYNTISGFRFDSVVRPSGDPPASTNSMILLVGQHNRVTQCSFKSCGFQPDRDYARIVGVYYNTATDIGAAYSHVDHNYWYDSRGVSLGIIIGAYDSDPDRWPVYSTFEYNWFYKLPRDGSNGREAIQLCSGGNEFDIQMYTTVQYNYFYKADADPEICSVKCSDNTIRYNTFLHNNLGSSGFCLRGGDRNLVEGNFFIDQQYGMRVYGADNLIVNNYIHATYCGIETVGTGAAAYATTEDCLFAYNTLTKTASYGVILDSVGRGSTGASPGNTWYNNILQVNASNHDVVQDSLNGQAGTWNKNILWGSSSGWTPNGSTRADPQLTEYEGEIYRPGSNSPALDLGVDLDGSPWYLSDDIDGYDRDGSPDVGCDEVYDNSTYPPLRAPLHAEDVGPDYLNGVPWGDPDPDEGI